MGLGVLQQVLDGDALSETMIEPLLPCGETAAQMDLNLEGGGRGVD